jgi:hypothetical protein
MTSEEVRFGLFSLDDLAQVPSTLGVYAWFLRRPVPIQNRQWDAFLKTAQEIIDFSDPERLELSSPTRLRSRWRGDLRLTHTADETGRDEPDIFARGGQDLFIRHLNTVLTTLPVLLYIGKAENLKRRIGQHITAIERYEEPTLEDLQELEARQFAERVYKRQIPKAYLRFTFFEFPASRSAAAEDSASAISANQLVESWLNEILRPTFGEQ